MVDHQSTVSKRQLAFLQPGKRFAVSISMLAMLGLTGVGCTQTNNSKCVGANDGQTKCVAASEAGHTDPELVRLVHLEWQLIEFPGFDSAYLAKREATMMLMNPSTLSAYMGCNQLGSGYRILLNRGIRFEPVISTRMACLDDDEMKLEQAFSAMLPTMTRYQIQGDKLMLSNDEGQTMRFIVAN